MVVPLLHEHPLLTSRYPSLSTTGVQLQHRIGWLTLAVLELQNSAPLNVHSILWAGVQPTLDPYAEAFYSRLIALTLGGEEFSVNDVYMQVCA